MDEQLSSMVANDVYVRARSLTSAQARAKNWRQMLTFPNIYTCDTLQRRLEQVGYEPGLRCLRATATAMPPHNDARECTTTAPFECLCRCDVKKIDAIAIGADETH